MKQAESLDRFRADPVGTWFRESTCVVWCSSPSLVGATAWGSPDAAATHGMTRVFESLWASTLDERVDVVIDGSSVDPIHPEGLATFVAWIVEHRADVVRRVRQQIGVVGKGLAGVTLAGILPIVGDTHPFRVVHDAIEAHRLLSGAAGEALYRVIQEIVGINTGVTPELQRLRETLRDDLVSSTLAGAARAVGISARSLQRALATQGSSFQRELRDARYARACELLTATNERIAAVAHRVGLGERALTRLVRQGSGRTPGALRRAGVR